jgi:hypothetical protein
LFRQILPKEHWGITLYSATKQAQPKENKKIHRVRTLSRNYLLICNLRIDDLADDFENLETPDDAGDLEIPNDFESLVRPDDLASFEIPDDLASFVIPDDLHITNIICSSHISGQKRTPNSIGAITDIINPDDITNHSSIGPILADILNNNIT